MSLDAQIAMFDDALSTLVRTFTVNERRFPAAEGRATYSPHDFESLGFLDANPGSRAKDIAAFLDLKPTTMQSIVDRLINRGLVRRDDRHLKGRAIALFLTDEGVSLREAIKRQNLANCERMLQALPEANRAAFVKSISTIAKSVSEDI